ncbi:MAG: hypothetical protein WDM92_07345 [Caulobacteraceae bacterium]
MGRRPADGHDRRRHAGLSGIGRPDPGPADRGDRGRGAGLSRDGLCGVRGPAADAVRQPAAGAELRGVPPPAHRRPSGAGGDAEGRLSDPRRRRVRLRDRDGVQPADDHQTVAANVNNTDGRPDIMVALDQLQAQLAERRAGHPGGRLVRRRPALRRLPGAPGRGGDRQGHRALPLARGRGWTAPTPT